MNGYRIADHSAVHSGLPGQTRRQNQRQHHVRQTFHLPHPFSRWLARRSIGIQISSHDGRCSRENLPMGCQI